MKFTYKSYIANASSNKILMTLLACFLKSAHYVSLSLKMDIIVCTALELVMSKLGYIFLSLSISS